MNRVEPKITFRIVREVLGVNEHFELITDDDYQELLDKWKVQVVAARQACDATREVELNNCKAWILQEKKDSNAGICPRCGKAKTRTSQHCGVCAQGLRAGASPAQPRQSQQPTTNMNLQEIIQNLEREKTEQERICAAAHAKVQQIGIAIDALSGRQHIPGEQPARNDGPSVTEMIAEAAKRLNAATPGAAFDHKTLVNEASQLYPDRHSLLKRGIYLSVNQLRKRNVLALAPGGFILV